MSAIGFWSWMKIPTISNGRKPKTNREIVSLKVPNLTWEENKNIPYLCRINPQDLTPKQPQFQTTPVRCVKRKKQRKRINLVKVPDIKDLEGMSHTWSKLPSEDEILNVEEFVCIPVVERLSREELLRVECMLREKKNKKKGEKQREFQNRQDRDSNVSKVT